MSIKKGSFVNYLKLDKFSPKFLKFFYLNLTKVNLKIDLVIISIF